MIASLILLLLVAGADLPADRWETGIHLDGCYAVRDCALPFDPLDESDERCIELALENGHRLRIDAAGTLILRGAHAEFGLETLLDLVADRPGPRPRKLETQQWTEAMETWKWAVAFAGDLHGSLFARRLDAADTDLERRFLLEQLARISPQSLPATADSLAEIASGESQSKNRALAQLVRVCEVRLLSEGRPQTDSWYHFSSATMPLQDSHAEARLAEVFELRLSQARGRFRVPDLQVLHSAGIASQRIRDACMPHLEEAFAAGKRFDGELLRILGHFGSEHDAVRTAYIEAWNAHDSGKYDSLPCRRVHDAETKAAFQRVFELSSWKRGFTNRLKFMGEMDARTSPRVGAALADLQGYGAFLLREGFRGHIPIGAEDSEMTQVNKLAITIATLQEEERDCGDQVRALAALLSIPAPGGGGGWGDFHLHGWQHVDDLNLDAPELIPAALAMIESDLGIFSRDKCARKFLSRVELTPEQRDSYSVWVGAVDYDELESAGVSSETQWLTKSSVPHEEDTVTQLRNSLHGGLSGVLLRLLADGLYCEQDERYLRAVLARGMPSSRKWGLELIEHYELDSPKLRALIELRTEDSDSIVRATAQRISDSRGW